MSSCSNALVAVLYAGLCAPAFADDSIETAPTQDGVRAVEAHWTRAFLSDDETYLNALLDDDYVSVNAKGVARPKAAILALAKKIAATPGRPPVAPPQPIISIRGNAAIVTWSGGSDISVDVFRYQNGAWHAWYSQHTAISPG